MAVAIEGRARNPVRRSNSSPEMNSNWRNPFLAASLYAPQEHREGEPPPPHTVIAGGAAGDGLDPSSGERWEGGKQEPPACEPKKLLNKPMASSAKDPRVSYEAIPEEIFGAGTTPPTTSSMVHQVEGGSSEHATTAPGPHPPAPPRPSSSGVDGPPSLPAGRSPSSSAAFSPSSSSPSLLASGSVRAAKGVAEGLRSPTTALQAAAAKVASSPAESHAKVAVASRKQEEGSAVEGGVGAQPPGQVGRPDPSSLPPLAFKRDRGHTISVMSPVRKPPPRVEWDSSRSGRGGGSSPRGPKEAPRTGINPSFVFLQLYYNAHFGSTSEKPILVPPNNKMAKIGLRNLDYIPPYETHKIGVIYVGPGQANSEADILRNQFGSLRYAEFLQRLGTIVRLSDIDPHTFCLGGLDRSGNDGKFTYIWHDDVTQIVFHVATLMTTTERFNEKKKHIGNDYVTIVYNESGEDYNIQTVKGQFNYACVEIQPLDHGTNKVTVKTKEELAEHIGHSEPRIISDQNVAILARQLALHADLASLISCSLKTMGQSPYASNWLERLRQIKRLRAKVIQEIGPSGGWGVAGGDGGAGGSTLSPEGVDFTSPVSASQRLSAAGTRRGVMMEDFTEYT